MSAIVASSTRNLGRSAMACGEMLSSHSALSAETNLVIDMSRPPLGFVRGGTHPAPEQRACQMARARRDETFVVIVRRRFASLAHGAIDCARARQHCARA